MKRGGGEGFVGAGRGDVEGYKVGELVSFGFVAFPCYSREVGNTTTPF